MQHTDRLLVQGPLDTIIRLPEHLQHDYKMDWLSINTFDFFNSLNSLIGSLQQFCQAEVPMNGPGGVEYMWTDSQKRQMRVSAPQYIDAVLSHIQSQLDDELVFPTKSSSQYPSDFLTTIRWIFRQFIRLFAHVYHTYYDKILLLECEAHWNTLLVHVYLFAVEFDLLQHDGKKECACLQDLIDSLVNHATMKLK